MVDEYIEEHSDQKHLTFSGIKIGPAEPNPNSPFKNPNAEQPEKGLSALKDLNLLSGDKNATRAGISAYEQAKIDRRKNKRIGGGLKNTNTGLR